jgi:hypothetical protein
VTLTVRGDIVFQPSKITMDAAREDVVCQPGKFGQGKLGLMRVVTMTIYEIKRQLGDGIRSFSHKEMNARNTRLGIFIQVKVAVEESARMLCEGKGYFADIKDDDSRCSG